MLSHPAAETRSHRKGVSVVFTVICLVVLFSMAALAIDIGYLYNARAEVQRSADSAALAACWEMGDQLAAGGAELDAEVRGVAANAAGMNNICNKSPLLDGTDVTFGYLADIFDRDMPLDTSDQSRFNAVTVRVRRNSAINGQVRTYFARVMGIPGVGTEATATAVILHEIAGFETPNDGSNIDILPFALDEDTWNSMMAGVGSDSYSWNEETQQIQAGSDNVLEMNLYPQGTGSPGNRGTVDIGGSNNSTNDIARQILHGISADDMAAMGGSLEFDANGELTLNGDTGISAGVKDELASIIGEVRIIPIFSNVQGPGNNADYTIVKWCGVRIMDVKLTGPKKQKRLTIQKAPASSPGIIPSPGTTSGSEYLFSRAFLVR